MQRKQNSMNGLRRMIRSVALVPLLAGGLQAAATNDAPDFKEVYELLKANLAGVTDTELNRAAVAGLLSELRPQVRVIGEAGTAAGATNAALKVTTAVYEGGYGYVRMSQMNAGADKQFAGAWQQLTATNKLKGLVLDLRFAGGQDYAAAAAIGDWFFPAEQPLVDWGQGVKNSTAKTNAITLPVMVLVNQKTGGAAEALAGVLRQGQVSLLLGAKTAGQASIAREFTLKNGQHLRIATAPVKVGNEQALPLAGLTPDIPVEVSPEQELAYFEDAYKLPPGTARLAAADSSTNEITGASTNRTPRRRINEAELVRMQREGQNLEIETTIARTGRRRLSEAELVRMQREGPDSENALAGSDAEHGKPVVQDPALARALDLLKGLAVVQHRRAP